MVQANWITGGENDEKFITEGNYFCFLQKKCNLEDSKATEDITQAVFNIKKILSRINKALLFVNFKIFIMLHCCALIVFFNSIERCN